MLKAAARESDMCVHPSNRMASRCTATPKRGVHRADAIGPHPEYRAGRSPLSGATQFGDDEERFARSRARKNYSGQSPITRASGKKSVVLARYATNRRLAAAGHLQAFAALGASPDARAYYDALRARNIAHHAALRQLANRLVGILHGCL